MKRWQAINSLSKPIRRLHKRQQHPHRLLAHNKNLPLDKLPSVKCLHQRLHLVPLIKQVLLRKSSVSYLIRKKKPSKTLVRSNSLAVIVDDIILAIAVPMTNALAIAAAVINNAM